MPWEISQDFHLEMSEANDRARRTGEGFQTENAEKEVEIQVQKVESAEEVPFNPGGYSLATDGNAFLVIHDEIEEGLAARFGGSLAVARRIEIRDHWQPHVFYGIIFVSANSVVGGGVVGITSSGIHVSQALSGTNMRVEHGWFPLVQGNHTWQATVSAPVSYTMIAPHHMNARRSTVTVGVRINASGGVTQFPGNP